MTAMKLTFEQIQQITVGSLCTEAESDGIHFHKCTQKQVDAWTALSKTVLILNWLRQA
jgi:hypothetical protein